VVEAVVAGELEVCGELGGGDMSHGFWADGPYGGDPGEVSAAGPLVGEIEPETGADVGMGFDAGAGFEGEERGIADEEGGVGVGEHGDGVGGRREEYGVGTDEFAEEDLRVGEGTARGRVSGDGADGGEGAVDVCGVAYIRACLAASKMRGFFPFGKLRVRMTIINSRMTIIITTATMV
jgi:hypothetical protein